MTPPIDDPETLRRILANTEALLLDFDGPICSVFSGFPAPIVADQLRGILAEGGHTTLPEPIQTATDPFDILFYAATLGPEEARYVEAAFRAHEVEAMQTAQPTRGAHELIRVWKSVGKQLGIVSNNSGECIEVYLNKHNLETCVDNVSARRSADVGLLKPSPHLVLSAARALATSPSRCAFVGDSRSDLESATAADVAAIGFANKPGKADNLSGFGAPIIDSVGSIEDLL